MLAAPIASDMLAAQAKLQNLRAVAWLNPSIRGDSLLRRAVETQTEEVDRCAALLARTTAANDEGRAPSAA